jgi:hypothetical protein
MDHRHALIPQSGTQDLNAPRRCMPARSVDPGPSLSFPGRAWFDGLRCLFLWLVEGRKVLQCHILICEARLKVISGVRTEDGLSALLQQDAMPTLFHSSMGSIYQADM